MDGPTSVTFRGSLPSAAHRIGKDRRARRRLAIMVCRRPDVAGPRAESVQTTVRAAGPASTVGGPVDAAGVPITRSVTYASIDDVVCGAPGRGRRAWRAFCFVFDINPQLLPVG